MFVPDFGDILKNPGNTSVSHGGPEMYVRPYLMGSKFLQTTNVLLLLVQALFAAESVKYQFLKSLCHVP